MRKLCALLTKHMKQSAQQMRLANRPEIRPLADAGVEPV